MDTEEDTEIRIAKFIGRPETDEGPYYHDAWWESYKGSVKGKLGGAVIGGLVGLAVGLAAAAVLPLVGAVSTISTGVMIAAFSAGGMIYGMHEFSEVGKVTGAVAAAQEKAEQRENGKFAEIKREISELKSLITGSKTPKIEQKSIDNSDLTESEQLYRTTHCDEHCPPKNGKFVFWKVAAVGLIAGVAAGALLAYGGLAGSFLGELGITKVSSPAIMTVMGLFGASFGLNRDMFRRIFDKTDLLFKGIFHNSSSRGQQVTMLSQSSQQTEKSIEKSNVATPPIITVVYPEHPDYPQSDTFHRDKLATATKLALLNMDHNKSIRQ